MATRYENLSGVNANYIDGTFASLSHVAAGQCIMLLGAAEKGLSGTRLSVILSSGLNKMPHNGAYLIVC